ncbi:MAG: phosphodiester glycosidase family protein [Acidimicrobiales bacterium]
MPRWMTGRGTRRVPVVAVAVAVAVSIAVVGPLPAVATPRRGRNPAPRPAPLAPPRSLSPFVAGASPADDGSWHPAGRLVDGHPAVYETALVPPGGSSPAGIAWMDTRLLSARLYSGSLSPGGGPYTYTAPVEPPQAATLVAAFNGGFQMQAAGGGYYTEGRMVVPVRAGAASLVIYKDGSVDVGTWGADVKMTPDVVAVRQNLVPLVSSGRPTALAASADWQAWGATCGADSCASSVPGIESQWRSAVGVTADGALVFVAGPSLDPLQLAQLLVRAGVIRGMELDINPDWPVLATYDPPPGALASPANGSRLIASSIQGPATFFDPSWNRDFVTMSARPSVVTGTIAFPVAVHRTGGGHRAHVRKRRRS